MLDLGQLRPRRECRASLRSRFRTGRWVYSYCSRNAFLLWVSLYRCTRNAFLLWVSLYRSVSLYRCAHIVRISGESYRLKDKKKAGQARWRSTAK